MPIVTTSSESVPATYAEQTWQQILASAVRDPLELCRLLDLPESLHEAAQSAARQFPLLVPRPFIARMRSGDPHDPLLRQVLPIESERSPVPGFSNDPLAEQHLGPTPGLIQKYASRVLIVAAPTCAVHCRYCFRRHFPYQQTPRSVDAWQSAVQTIADDPTVEEVILSGGDPLSMDERKLVRLIEQLEPVPHLRRLRLHTRLPIVVPQRVTTGLLSLLQSTRLKSLVVVHANHPAELDASVGRALRQMVAGGIVVLNQSVLLHGVNDRAETLIELSRHLVNLGVMPYYLHQLDPVHGAAHFHVPIERGIELMKAVHTALPGYAVPRYVQEQPGLPAKTIIY